MTDILAVKPNARRNAKPSEAALGAATKARAVVLAKVIADADAPVKLDSTSEALARACEAAQRRGLIESTAAGWIKGTPKPVPATPKAQKPKQVPAAPKAQKPKQIPAAPKAQKPTYGPVAADLPDRLVDFINAAESVPISYVDLATALNVPRVHIQAAARDVAAAGRLVLIPAGNGAGLYPLDRRPLSGEERVSAVVDAVVNSDRHPLSRSDLSDMTGLSLSAVDRAIVKAKRRGLIWSPSRHAAISERGYWPPRSDAEAA